MFIIENAIPFRNGTLIQGKFTISHPTLNPGEQLLIEKAGQRIGMAKFNGILSVNYLRGPSNPMYHISIAFDGDYHELPGASFRLL